MYSDSHLVPFELDDQIEVRVVGKEEWSNGFVSNEKVSLRPNQLLTQERRVLSHQNLSLWRLLQFDLHVSLAPHLGVQKGGPRVHPDQINRLLRK